MRFRNSRGTRAGRAALSGAAALLAVAIAACGGSSGPAGGNRPSPAASAPVSATAAAVPGGTARVALPAGVTLNWIWPYLPRTSASVSNAGGFERLLYRPLYLFGGNGPSVTVNYPLSTARAPAYSDGGKTVTITMKGWKWSDGETVDASDVIFWLSLMKARPAGYYGYAPGLLPDNLASYRAAGPDTVVLHLKSAVSSIWFTYNQLAEITPLPAAWDVTSVRAKAGSGGCATDTAADKWAKCTAVFNFLTAQARDTKTYATSPLWGVVDGPWKLSGFTAALSGQVASFTANTAFSGSPKPRLAGLTYYAYPDDTIEYTALKAGKLDLGYIPARDLAPVQGSQTLPAASPLGPGYTMRPAYQDGIRYFLLNFSNPRLGRAFRQLYVRQAIQELINQEGMISHDYRGYGYPTSGGVPTQPSNQWAPAIQNQNGGQGPYPFSVAGAVALLTAHGWKEVGGVMTCATPSRCGAGIRQGTRLSFSMDYAAGVRSVHEEVAVIRNDLARGGLQLTLVPQSSRGLAGEPAPCKPAQASCMWAVRFGGWNFNGPGFEPTGEPLFATGASSNAGSYSDPEMDALIDATHTSNSLSEFQVYATYLAAQLPAIWLPSAYGVAAVSARLANVGSNTLGTLLPEYWYFTG